MSSTSEDYVWAAAIDFGTTFSGYAFSPLSSKTTIYTNKNWGDDSGHQSYKTPTSVLLDERGNFKAFGFEAEEEYLNAEVDKKGYHLYKHFKMLLHKKGVTRQSTIKSISGKDHDALDIFSMALKYLKGHLLGAIAKQTTTEPPLDKIRWVLTVPAIWNDEAKQFMREAAYKGELTESIDSGKLLLALEPEVASLFCRSLKTDNLTIGEEVDGFKPGVKYMVIDAGGGTIDIAVHEALQNKKVKELHAPNGGDWGGTKVDENFKNLLTDVMGSQFVTAYQSKCPGPWLDLLREFERAKKSGKNNMVAIELGYNIFKQYDKLTDSDLEETIKRTERKGVTFSNGKLVLRAEALSELFDPVTDHIVSHVKWLLQDTNLPKFDFALLVGGFGDCSFLQKALKDEFDKKAIKLLVPMEAQLSVIKGAIQYGHTPSGVESRIAKKTYGNSYCSNFNPDKHDDKYSAIYGGIKHCDNLFEIHVQKGDQVETDHTVNLQYYPVTDGQSKMTIPLYAIDRRCSTSSPEYVVTSGFEKVGQVTVDMPGRGKGRTVDLKVIFGGTEIQVTAKDRNSGKNASAKIDFLTNK